MEEYVEWGNFLYLLPRLYTCNFRNSSRHTRVRFFHHCRVFAHRISETPSRQMRVDSKTLNRSRLSSSEYRQLFSRFTVKNNFSKIPAHADQQKKILRQCTLVLPSVSVPQPTSSVLPFRIAWIRFHFDSLANKKLFNNNDRKAFSEIIQKNLSRDIFKNLNDLAFENIVQIKIKIKKILRKYRY